MPPSPTAAAHRFTEPDRTSPAAKMPGQLVYSAPGFRSIFFHAGASATAWSVLTNPFSSHAISDGSQLVHGLAPIIEKSAQVWTVRRSWVFVSSISTDSRFLLPFILRTSVLRRISILLWVSIRRDR